MSSTLDDRGLSPLPQVDCLARIALVGNPNAGKTSLFNQLTGLRAQTANFPGTTVEHRRGQIELSGRPTTLIDLPGLYTLDAVTPDEQVAVDALSNDLPAGSRIDAMLIVLDATNLERNLFLASQILNLNRPTVVALNMIDLAEKHHLQVDVAELSARLGCPVVPISARSGQGLDALRTSLENLVCLESAPASPPELATCGSCSGCQYSSRYSWAEQVGAATLSGDTAAGGRQSEAIDRFLTHRFVGLVAFATTMLLTFLLIFWMAQYPMKWIDALFGFLSATTAQWLPEGDLSSLVCNGIIGGVGGMLVFLPQICILFFLLALLEDSGYLARAAFVMDRLMHRVGLPGKAFVPLLSAHACAIPAIMATRVIEDRRDRLATILVLPLMTCSARLPVYAMVMGLMFPASPLQASLLFVAAYALGIVTALVMAWFFKSTLLKGKTRPLIIELPNYRVPSLRNALLQTIDRAWAFVKTAGTTILAISVIIWILSAYPKTPLLQMPVEVQQQVAQLQAEGDSNGAELLMKQICLEYSFAGRIGHSIEPLFAPLGFDWKMSVGVLSSFAAREVIISTMAVLYGIADDDPEKNNKLLDRLRRSHHSDGSPVFTSASCLSLLVFFVLAMQCLPTQVVTRRETGTWKWAALQFGYMSVLAYSAALVTYQTALYCGLG